MVRKPLTEDEKARDAKRREMGYEPLNPWFIGCHGHHIDHIHVIHIPEEMHVKYCGHNHYKPETMVEVNKAAWVFLESQNEGQTEIVSDMVSDLQRLNWETTGGLQPQMSIEDLFAAP